MDAASAAASVSASTSTNAAYILLCSTFNLGLGTKGRTFLLYVRKSYLELFPLCFESLVHIVLIVWCAGVVFTRLSSGTIAILLGFEPSSFLGFTIIFVHMLTWGSGRSLSSLTNLEITWSFSEFIGSSWSGRSDVVLLSFFWRLDSLTVDNVESLCKL